MACLRRWAGEPGTRLGAVGISVPCCCLGPLGVGAHPCLGGSIPSLGYVQRRGSLKGLRGWRRSYDRDPGSQAENSALFKFYWTPFDLGLLPFGSVQLPRGKEGGRTGRRKGLETNHWPSRPMPGEALPVSIEMAQGPPVQAAPLGQSSASGYVAGVCPLASRPATRLRAPSVGAAPGPRAAPFLSCGHS